MRSYSDALNQELNTTTLGKSFVRAKEQTSQKDEVSFFLCFCFCFRSGVEQSLVARNQFVTHRNTIGKLNNNSSCLS